MGAFSKRAARLIKLGVLVLLLLAAVSALLVGLGVRLDLSALQDPIELGAGRALGREVEFNGPIMLVPSLSPTIEIADVSIANPPGFGEQGFARLGLLRLQLELLPLISAQIHVSEITAEGVRLNLQNSASGKPNWSFGLPEPALGQEGPASESSVSRPAAVFVGVDKLSLTDIEVNYEDLAIERSIRFGVRELKGAMPAGEPLNFSIQGELDARPFNLQVTLGRRPARGGAWPLRVFGDIAGTPIESEARAIDTDIPEIRGSLTLGGVDVGALLQWLGVVNGLEARVGSVTAEVRLRGDSLSDIVADSDLMLRVEEGNWLLRDANSGATFDIAIALGEVLVQPGKPINIKLDSRLESSPLKIGVSGAVLEDYLKLRKALPLRLHVVADGADLVLETRAERPIDTSKLAFQVALKGKSIASLSGLLGRDLPPFGPYLMKGTFALVANGYEVSGLEMRIAETSLKGRIGLDTRRIPPYLDVDLRSERLQLNDFKLGNWSPTPGVGARKGVRTEKNGHDPAGASLEATEMSDLLEGKVLRAQDISASLTVDAVLSGKDRLGRGSLRLLLKQGHLQLDPIELTVPGGDASVRFSYFPTGKRLELGLEAAVEQFDYGFLARRIDPASKVEGRLSLDVGISANGSSIDDLLANGNGHLDFGVWPGKLKADVFELWAVNVIGSLANKLDDASGSKVNCVIARFSLEDGVMNDHIIFADMTRMRIESTAQIDFNRRTLNVLARPKAKRPEFFSLATPVRLTGSFDDYAIRVNPLELGGTAFSFVTSPLHVPLRRLFRSGKQPAEAQQACIQTWQASDALTAGKTNKDALPH